MANLDKYFENVMKISNRGHTPSQCAGGTLLFPQIFKVVPFAEPTEMGSGITLARVRCPEANTLSRPSSRKYLWCYPFKCIPAKGESSYIRFGEAAYRSIQAELDHGG